MLKGNVTRVPAVVTAALLLTGFFVHYQFLDTSQVPRKQLSYYSTDRYSQSNGSSDSRRRLPKALIIGFNKCGTSTLRSFLTIHPLIVSPKKEVRFFNDHYSKGLEWYRLQMPLSRPDQVTIEKTPGYIKSSKVMKRIYEYDPDVKMLVIVRNPVTRLQSIYAHNMYHRTESARVSIETWLQTGKRTLFDRVREAANFVEAFQGAFTIFPREQFLILSEEELETDPSSIIKKVQYFLGLPPINTNNLFVFDKRKGFYCVNTTNPLFFTTDIKHLVNETNGCMRDNKGREHPEFGDDLLRKIIDMSSPYVDKLFHVIPKTFQWNYF